MNQEELKYRTKEFALRIIKLCNALPSSPLGRTIRNQLIRCGTSVGANYRASCRSRSKNEFIAKLGIVEEEADESAFWLELIIETKIQKEVLVKPLLIEANELVSIIASSIITAKKNNASLNNQKSKIRNQKSK